ncbi:LytR/AlgR family response regulator transcription factor [Thalassotalea euphylliae]|uniref:DNA-binding response regulator n=1 Tax=Thalassotalea euphylliae TaxID=1655234 RepID=A0A3E0U1B2_9GAMM|nr:LytTR family DNA-binding domain-containing protein [Thalassotalea euphylliae]REL29822.1 DNA-binding response regulator [Thalassotalea euphylliae]
MLNILVADDEPLARETIKLLLANQTDVGHVYEAQDGNQVLDVFSEHHPDIVFLDIQMPGKTGIELAEQLPNDTVIIFATAYDQFAITAFELNAIGYLLKPFDDDKFYAALDRARQQVASKSPTNFKKVGQLIQHMVDEQDRAYKTRLVVKDPGRIRLVDVDQINFIAGAGNYAEVHLFDDKPVLHRETLTSLEKQLDPNVFVRIHRSTIVRRSSVIELRPNENGDYSVILKSGEQLTLSRRNKGKLEALIGEQ